MAETTSGAGLAPAGRGRDAAAHFAWARARAVEVLDLGDDIPALDSLISDLSKHPGTAGILHRDLLALIYSDVVLSGPGVIRSHVESLAGPARPPGTGVEESGEGGE